MNGKTLLLVEDSQEVQNYNKEMLEDEGFTIATAMTLSAARKYLDGHGPSDGSRPDAIILDIGMPDGNGLDFLKELRQTSNIPVLLLTGYGEDSDVEKGFDSGCDDYLPKPYTFKILLMRIERLLERTEQVPEILTRGTLTLKPISSEAYVNGVSMGLSPKEYDLLQYFVQNESRVMTAEQVYEAVWGQPMIGDATALRVAVSNLRKKLAGCGYTVSSTRGAGYCFERGEP